MRPSFFGAAWLALLLTCFATLSHASSSRPLPLKRYGQATDVRMEIVARDESHSLHHRRSSGFSSSLKPASWMKRSQPGQVLHSDKIRLSFRAFAQDFHLHLEPTENLIHPDGAQVRYVDRHPQTGEPVVVRTERLYPHDVRAFQGVVMHPDHTSKRLAEDRVGVKRGEESAMATEGVMGHAAIMLRDDGTESGKHSFEGTFSWAGNEHTIQLPLNYLTSRQNGDPAISRRSVDRGTPIVHRRSDIMTTLEARSAGIEVRDGSLECSADNHEFNSQNRLFLTESNNDNASTSPLSFFVAPPKQARRSLFPFIRDSATELFSTRRSPVLPTDGADTFSYERATLRKRQGGGDLMGGSNNDSFTADIGSTSGCPSSAQAMYMGIASDCTYTGRFSDSSGARTQILNNMNSVSDIYRRTFRVSLGVVELEIREAANCPTTASGDEAWNVNCDGASLDSRLSSFSQWRGNNAANGTGLWHLLTTCSSGQEVGVAWLGTLCQTEATSQGSDVISGTGVSAATQQEAQVMAHEIGHNFGAIHDCISGCSLQGVSASQNGGAVCCPQSTTSCNSNGAFIMSPVSQADTDTFSPCSIGNICTMLGTGLNTTCINDPNVNPRETLSVQQCGNGIREPGEECDAGPNGSSCCSANCTLTSGSVCDPESSVCCTDSCQFAPTTTVCRPAVDERCDTAETCSGSSDVCPSDVRKDDGSSCASGLTCASGHCTSRDLQCQQQSQANMDFTTACPVSADNSCSVSCENPSSSSSCLILQQNFIDGTECGYGGTCEGGACQSGSWQATFQSWYRNNLRISIPVTIVIGLLILAILYGLGRCLYNRMRGGRSHKASGGAAVLPGRRRGNRSSQQPYRGPPPPTHPNGYQPQYQQQQGQWVDPNAYNGPARGGYPSY